MKKNLKALSLVSAAALTLAQAPAVLAADAPTGDDPAIQEPVENENDDKVNDNDDINNGDNVENGDDDEKKPENGDDVENGDDDEKQPENGDDIENGDDDEKQPENGDDVENGDDDEKQPENGDDNDKEDDEEVEDGNPWAGLDEDDIADFDELGDAVFFAQKNIREDANIYIRYHEELEVYQAIIQEDGEGIVDLLGEIVEDINEEVLSYSSYQAAEDAAKIAIEQSDEEDGFNAYEILELEDGAYSYKLYAIDLPDEDKDVNQDDDKEDDEDKDVNQDDDKKDDEDKEDDEDDKLVIEDEENNVNGYDSKKAAVEAAEKALEENDNFSVYRISKRGDKYFFTLGNNLPEDEEEEDEKDITERQEENYQNNIAGFDSEEDAIKAAEQALKDNDNLNDYKIVKGEDGKYRFIGFFNELEDEEAELVQKESAVEQAAGSKEQALPETGEVSSFAAIGTGIISALSGAALFFRKKRD